MEQSFWKTVWDFLIKINKCLLYDTAIPLPHIYSGEMKAYVQTMTFTWMVTAAVSVIAKTWKQPKCPSTDEWITNCYPLE